MGASNTGRVAALIARTANSGGDVVGRRERALGEERAGDREDAGGAEDLTKAPGTIDDAMIQSLRSSGWSEQGIWEATALISFFNFTGHMEAASGLPPDEVPAARPPEARADVA